MACPPRSTRWAPRTVTNAHSPPCSDATRRRRSGRPEQGSEGRFWTGSDAPAKVADSLADHVPHCPPELAARLALVHVAETDDGRALKPGEWLVTLTGALRRWDGFIARGEGAAEAARLEAENRFVDLERELPALREASMAADAAHSSATGGVVEQYNASWSSPNVK